MGRIVEDLRTEQSIIGRGEKAMGYHNSQRKSNVVSVGGTLQHAVICGRSDNTNMSDSINGSHSDISKTFKR